MTVLLLMQSLASDELPKIYKCEAQTRISCLYQCCSATWVQTHFVLSQVLLLSISALASSIVLSLNL